MLETSGVSTDQHIGEIRANVVGGSMDFQGSLKIYRLLKRHKSCTKVGGPMFESLPRARYTLKM